MIIIGRFKAVTNLNRPKLFFDGITTWFVWLFIHVISLLSFQNKLRTMYNWMIAYLTKDQHCRMMLSSKDGRPDES